MEEAEEKYPYIPNLPVHKSVYEQESILEFRIRAERVLSRIITENDPDSTVAIISHGGTIQQLYLSFLKLPIDSQIYHVTGDTGIHIWRYEGDKRIIELSNGQHHLNTLY